MSREANFKQLLTIATTAELLGVSRARGFELARNGTLPVVRLGRQVRVPLAALEKLINEGGKPLSNIQDTSLAPD